MPSRSSKDTTATTIRVVAPATLEEGFTFDVLLHGEPYTVTVPAGGVEQGEEFDIPYPTKSDTQEVSPRLVSIGSSQKDLLGAPVGRWRYPLWTCCDVLTQATFWMAFFCTPVLLAQLITRLRLTWKGLPTEDSDEASLSFNRIVLSYVTVLVVGQFLPAVGLFFTGIYVLVIMVWIGGNIRRTFRKRYRIAPIECCGCQAKVGEYVEDGLCMCLCSCCSLIQMARQTHDDKEFPGLCCTTTGLELDAPEIPYYLEPAVSSTDSSD